jgi:Family of unknown function (DUF6505)
VKFLKAVRLDASDEKLFQLNGAADDGEWCVSGGYAVCNLTAGGCGRVGCSLNEDGSPRSPACANSFVGLASHGRCTIAEVVAIDETSYRQAVELLVRHFIDDLGAPSEADARRVAEEECAYTRELCEGFTAEVWITVRREPTDAGIGEHYQVFERLMLGKHPL